MDLDNLKKDWQATKLDVRVNDDKVRQMLDNKGKSAFEKLLKVEKFGLWACIAAFSLAVLFYFDFTPGVGISYGVLLMFGVVWQLFMINMLKAIDVAQMDVMSVSVAINRYKTYLIRGIIWGSIVPIVWALYACFTFAYKVFLRDNLSMGSVILLASLVFIFSVGFAVALCYFIYSNYYFNNIREIERSIKEVEEYKKDNVD